MIKKVNCEERLIFTVDDVRTSIQLSDAIFIEVCHGNFEIKDVFFGVGRDLRLIGCLGHSTGIFEPILILL